MGRFGIQFTPGEWQVVEKAPEPRRPFALRRQVRTIVHEPPREETRLIDKAFAWLSYFVLLFSAFCVFQPAQTVLAAERINAVTAPVMAPVAKIISQRHAVSDSAIVTMGWELRK